MICKNRRCGVVLTEHYWGEGYCSQSCMHWARSHRLADRFADRLCDPTDPTGQRVIAETRAEIDAMLEAASIDARLPRIIYLRKREATWAAVGKACNLPPMTCYRILKSVKRKLLAACGLRTK